jgi:hypothetical protein
VTSGRIDGEPIGEVAQIEAATTFAYVTQPKVSLRRQGKERSVALRQGALGRPSTERPRRRASAGWNFGAFAAAPVHSP